MKQLLLGLIGMLAQNGVMKIKVDKYHSQWALGISYVFFNNQYKALIFDFAFFYVEITFKDYY